MGINDDMLAWRERERQRGKRRRGGRSGYGDGLTQAEIRETECPDCGAAGGADCDRSADPYPRADRERLQRERTCHWVRVLAAYGVPARRFGDYLVRHREGAKRTALPLTSHPAVELTACPRHDLPPGVPCPRPSWPYCQARKRRVVKAAGTARHRGRGKIAGPAAIASAPGEEDMSWVAAPARPGQQAPAIDWLAEYPWLFWPAASVEVAERERTELVRLLRGLRGLDGEAAAWWLRYLDHSLEEWELWVEGGRFGEKVTALPGPPLPPGVLDYRLGVEQGYE